MKKVNCTVAINVCTLRQFQVGIHLYRLKQILDARRERDRESTVDPSGISAGISKCELLNLLYCLSHNFSHLHKSFIHSFFRLGGPQCLIHSPSHPCCTNTHSLQSCHRCLNNPLHMESQCISILCWLNLHLIQF